MIHHLLIPINFCACKVIKNNSRRQPVDESPSLALVHRFNATELSRKKKTKITTKTMSTNKRQASSQKSSEASLDFLPIGESQ